MESASKSILCTCAVKSVACSVTITPPSFSPLRLRYYFFPRSPALAQTSSAVGKGTLSRRLQAVFKRGYKDHRQGKRIKNKILGRNVKSEHWNLNTKGKAQPGRCPK